MLFPKLHARSSIKYGMFKYRVKLRDGRICKICGSNKNIQVHHIKSYAKFFWLRINPRNALCLCNRCHGKIHKYELLKEVL